jgi:hypothetical protein
MCGILPVSMLLRVWCITDASMRDMLAVLFYGITDASMRDMLAMLFYGITDASMRDMLAVLSYRITDASACEPFSLRLFYRMQ